MKPLISTIIVAYQSEKNVNPCIESIKASARSAKLPLEVIIVVNDPINKSYRLPKVVKVIRSSKNLGYAAGINAGAKYARGKWILCINPDTLSNKKFFHNLIPHTKNSHVGIVTPKILNSDGTLQFTITNDFTIKNLIIEQFYLHKALPWLFSSPQSDPRYYEKPHPVEISFGTCFLIRRSLFKSLGGFCEDFFLYVEDYDFCRKVRNTGYQIMFEPHATQIHFGSQSNMGYKDGHAYLKSVRRYVRLHHSRIYTGVLMSILFAGSFIRYMYWTLVRKLRKSELHDKKLEFYRLLLSFR